MAVFPIIRLVVLGGTIIFACIATALSGHLYSIEKKWLYKPQQFPLEVIATGVLTVLTLPTMIIVDMIRKGAFTSMILVELIWLDILWVLWIVGGALSSKAFKTEWDIDCSLIKSLIGDDDDGMASDFTAACNEYKAITAFCFLAWVLLCLYCIALAIVSLVAASRGKPVWFTSVSNAVFFPPVPQPPPVAPTQVQYVVPQMTGQMSPVMATPGMAPGMPNQQFMQPGMVHQISQPQFQVPNSPQI